MAYTEMIGSEGSDIRSGIDTSEQRYCSAGLYHDLFRLVVIDKDAWQVTIAGYTHVTFEQWMTGRRLSYHCLQYSENQLMQAKAG
jgi:hypothetical protein